MKSRIAIGAAAAALILSTGAHAQIAVSANDGKQPHLGELPKDPTADTVMVLDMNHYPAKVLGSVEVPFSMIGPPTSLAMAHNGKFAIVTASQQLSPTDPTKFVPDDKVSVVDLTVPDHPKVVQTLASGAGATGVSTNRDDTLALVANIGAGTVSVFTISGMTLMPAGTVQLDPKPGPCDVAISPNGKIALVTQRQGSAMWRLAIDGSKVTDTGITIASGGQPYGAVFSHDSKFAYNTNLLGIPRPEDSMPREERPRGPRTPRSSTITAIDMATNQVVDTVEVGPTSEHIALSPNGKYVEVTVVNGSSSRVGGPGYNDFGLIKVFAVKDGHFTPVAEAKTCQWGQGAAWNKKGDVILLQCAIAKDIETYRFDGKTLTLDPSATIPVNGRPGAIATSMTR